MKMIKLLLNVALSVTLLAGYSCSSGEHETKGAEATEQVAAATYVCPMACEGEKTYTEEGMCPVCNMKLENLEKEAARVDKLPIGHRDRSPSPPPVYGPDGKRKNTRAVRWREKYTMMRQDTLEKILKLSNGSAAVAVAPSLFNRKRSKKVYIPLEQHPNYNFIGLIIGPIMGHSIGLSFSGHLFRQS